MANTSAKKRDASALNNIDRANLTPMMAQYMQIKDAHPDCLLFYRMGDFYELFFEDAVQASASLDITLTKRGKNGGVDIPMCGVPVHSHESYLSRLIRYGYRVAICEQVETPDEAKKRAQREGMPKSKALVKRDVVRVITPGTLTEDSLLDTRAHNYLCAVAETGGDIGLSWLDMSTGDFTLQAIDPTQLSAALERLEPSELLIPEKLQQRESLFETWANYREELTIQPNSRFDSENARKRLEGLFGVGTLEGFGGFSRAEITAAGALIDYAELTQKGKLPRINPPRQLAAGQVMEIDAATRRNLELTRTLSGERKGSLLSTIDMTVTAAGARLLGEHLAMPLTDVTAINARLDMVDYYLDQSTLRGDCREALKHCPDIERALGRLSLGRGGPRDLAAIRDGLFQANAMRRILITGDDALNMLPTGIADALKRMDNTGAHSPLTDRLDRALAEDLPLMARDGGFIARGYSDTLDEFRSLRDDSRKLIAGLQKDYADKTGISSLKIKHNNVIGYHVEVTANHGDKLMAADSGFIHRQTMANAVRFTTVELSGLERKIAEAADRALALEQEIFAQLVSDVLAHDATIAATARALAELDVAAAAAELSAQRGFCRPVVDDSLSFDIHGGRHPVVEAALRAQEGQEFIPNDCDLGDASRLWLLTGPNMAGKSTFLRQNALIALMAQMGGHVPAASAHIGVVDRLFSRVGAADDLARGRSTFMVEMVETAAILNQAGPRSLVILDEIGRGTATFDGLSIAWACVEHLHDANKCRGLFATHYHELTSLTARLDKLSCHTMRVKEWQGDVVFLHEVGDGTADRSYGIHVARLAGLPKPVILRAEDVLQNLEEGEQSGSLAKLADDLPLFSHSMAAAQDDETPDSTAHLSTAQSAALTRLAEINPDNMTPREALDVLYNLKTLSEG